MEITVRAERVADYSAIADLTYDAFVRWRPSGFKAEPLLVDMLRHNERFDPDLSLVAEVDNRVVGHALFSPFEATVLGARQMVVFLAPLCVTPALQRRGIGGALLEHGHKVAQSKGYALALLCGHPAYYPRFGYQQRMFSLAGCRVRLASHAKDDLSFEERPFLANDLPWVIAHWRRQHEQDSLALFPGETSSQWFSHAAGWRSSILTRAGEPAAYVRYRQADSLEVKEILSPEGVAGESLAWLLHRHEPAGGGDLLLPQSPKAAARLLGATALKITDARCAHEAFMLKVLAEDNQAVRAYCAAVVDGSLPPGVVTFPAVFDLDE